MSPFALGLKKKLLFAVEPALALPVLIINAEYRFGILIGSGGMLLGAKGAPFIKTALINLQNAFDEIISDSKNDEHQNLENVLININFPRWLYFFMGDRGFIHDAHKNGLKKKDMVRQPYRANE